MEAERPSSGQDLDPAEGETSIPDAEKPEPAVVQGWLTRIRPAAVLALLKDPDLGFAVSRVFLGFRPDAKGYANPLVRSRLVQAAVKDAKLADKLREMADAEPPAVSPVPKAADPVPEAAPTPVKPDPVTALRTERDQRRRERDDARHSLARAQAERETAQRAQKAAEAECEESDRLARKQAERISRLERQVARLQQAETRLLKALSEDKVSPPPSTPARSARAAQPEAVPPASPWITAVRHLLDKGKFDPALALAEDVLKSHAEDSDALTIAARALEGKKDSRGASAYVRRRLLGEIARQDMTAAAESLRLFLRLLPRPEAADAEVRQYLLALSPNDDRAVEAGRLLLSRLRGADPYTHGWLANLVVTQTALSPVLMPPPGALGLDDPLPLPLPPPRPDWHWSARRLAEAVDGNEAGTVEHTRAALGQIQAADPPLYARVWAALEQACRDDPSRLAPLRRAGRGPAVLDASNVAWFGQESLIHGQPRLRHLQAVRRTLRTRGFFPVLLYADANLPYFIDDPAGLRSMRDRQEILLVDAGTQADEVLVRMAKDHGAPLVTNDKMEDWDPEGEVVKVRYTISPGNEAHLLNEV